MSFHPSDYDPMRDSKRLALQPVMLAITLTLAMVTTWTLMHRYRGLMRDGQLYAFQASARLNPGLQSDFYLADTSQDRFTIFSRLYSFLIAPLGLQNAELLLFILCTVWFLIAAWVLAQTLYGGDSAWLAVAMLITTVGTYGAYSIFHYSEDYLTARSLAEALVVTGFAVHFRGRRIAALTIALGAMFIHPLMALPGLLLLLSLWMPIRTAIILAGSGVLATLGFALVAVMLPAPSHFISVMDADWLEVVRERSLHLFMQYWKLSDFEVLARPFLCLCFTAMAIDDERIRRLCAGAALVGASGLAVALIAGSVGPVAILLQGQAWRWMWVTTFISVLLIAPTVFRVWGDQKCGPICAILVVSGWTFPAVHGVALVSLAIILWSLKSKIELRTAEYLRWAGFTVLLIILVWMAANCWSLLTSARVGSGGEPAWIDRLKSIFGLQISAVLFIGSLWFWLRSNKSTWKVVPMAVLLTVSSIVLLPWSFEATIEVSRSQVEEFSDWRNAIPRAANVLILPARLSASFVWFTLQRPSYYSFGQAAGVVFSRATALKIRSRSEVLLPVMEPDWRLLSQITQETQGHKMENLTRPLTSNRLAAICGDPELGFVIAKETLGFYAIRHTHVGSLKDWNLYDCRRVRSAAPAA